MNNTTTPEEKPTMAKEKADKTIQVAFRFPPGLVERLDRHVVRMNAEHPGLDLNRADAVRSLLTRSLDALEKPAKRGSKG